MFLVNGSPVLSDDLEVLVELKNQLEANGIFRFQNFKVGPSNIQFNCPVHSDGQERKPSCGISTRSRQTAANETVPAGTVHCFTCGYTATLDEMISMLFGKHDEGAYGRSWLARNFMVIAAEERKDLQLDLGRGTRSITKQEYITEEELDRYRFYHDYMYKRRLTDDLIQMFDIGYDADFELRNSKGLVVATLECLTFPVRDTKGNTLFIARRAIHQKLFHYPSDAQKPVYGLYELLKYQPEAKEIIVAESALNALNCWRNGRPAVALLGLGTEYQYEQLRKLGARKYISGFDPDEAGEKATRELKRAMDGVKLVTSLVLPVGKDLNDLEPEEFEKLFEIF